MRQPAHLPLIVALAVMCGCLGGTETYTCPDGRQAQGPEECMSRGVVSTTLGYNARIRQCEGEYDDEFRFACLTNLAIDASDLSLCDRMGNMTWVRYCYGKLNMSHILPPEEATALPAAVSTTLQVTSTTTTSTLPCGNGILDEGEECDIGGICPKADGVCSISPTAWRLAVCLYNTTCEWDTQVAVMGGYDLGGCSGCHGRGSPQACACIRQLVLNSSTIKTTPGAKINDTQFAESGRGSPTTTAHQYHTECSGGLCRKVDGKGIDGCTTDSSCRHNECVGGKCVMVRSPGVNGCKADVECV
ncbi:MAG: hypothetical protein V1875_09780 [Candidatus Altiarchaeota archaeon]